MATRKINVKNTKDTRQCSCCYEDVVVENYFNINSEIFQYSSICKDCAKKIFTKIYDETQNLKYATIKLCTIMDVAFDNKKFDEVVARLENSKDEFNVFKVFIEYQRISNVTEKLKGKGFDIFCLSGNAENIGVVANPIDDSIGRWGEHIKKEDKKRLNELYSKFSKNLPDDDSIIESLLVDLCSVTLTIEKDNKVDKNAMQEKLRLINTLGLSPDKIIEEREKRQSQETWGAFIKRIEENKPAEIYQDKKKHADVDGFGKYMMLHFIRSVKNILKGHRDFPDIVVDEDGDIEIIDENYIEEEDLNVVEEKLNAIDEELSKKEVIVQEDYLEE